MSGTGLTLQIKPFFSTAQGQDRADSILGAWVKEKERAGRAGPALVELLHPNQLGPSAKSWVPMAPQEEAEAKRLLKL